MFGKGGNDPGVVSMLSRDKARKFAQLRVVEAYWHGLIDKDGRVPLRSAVDPRGMESALENAFLLERIAPGMAKIRVAGGHLSDIMGMQVTGMPLSTLIAAESRDRFSDAVKAMFADPAIVRLTLKAQEGFGRPAVTGQMILMPLRSDFGEVTRALGAFATDGRIGRAPRRFDIQSVDLERVQTGASVDPAEPSHAPVPDSVTPRPSRVPRRDAEPTPRPDGASAGVVAPEAQISRGHLTLVVSND
jgi:hypothetical protein